ncbi:MAG: sodium:solute symporter, partial [Bacteroidales bacterium]|nr:sodium:solute symporter [Bacteroidales bacterium]
IVVAKVLLPLYYRKNLTSIYTWLGERFGRNSHLTGTSFFMLSRLLGAAVRILAVMVVFNTFIPRGFVESTSGTFVFALVTLVFLVLLYLYTYKGGVKTIIWTDVLQTTFMLLAVGLAIWHICRDMGWNFGGMWSALSTTANPLTPGHGYMDWFDWNWSTGTNAVKQFLSGIFITVAMTGLDQAMMQKSLACKDLKAAQKNMYTTSLIIVAVNLFFLLLGALLCVYASSKGGFEALGITRTDELFPAVASRCLGFGVCLFFLIGLISAAYPSAGAAMTSLTTSICVDFLRFDKRKDLTEKGRDLVRKYVHACVAAAFFFIILALYLLSNDSVINLVYKLASYTYGPLLGIFFFGILTKCRARDAATPWIAVASPLLCLALNLLGKRYLGFDLGFTLLIVNGLITFALMWLFRERK